MYLKQLVNTGVAGVVEWRKMWNEVVLPYLRSQRLVAGRGVRINRLPAGTVIEAVDSSAHTPGAAGGGGIQIGIVTSVPAGGAGVGAYKPVTFTFDGATYTSGGATQSAVFPFVGNEL